MPDHIHTLLRQVEEGLIISKFMQAFKRETSAYARPKSYTASSLWLPHFDDVPIPNSKAAATRLSYMNYNPLRRGLADEVEKYLWSSARDYAGAGHGIVTVTNPFTGEVFGPGRAAEA
jgi:REP element-mobilizing transposase RayT